ncbi:MAG: regulatory signaling modulator protein AmpE [Gammaproteobacteria bacterium]|nr:regulatory signaling modulator protein AmpE [Gammaproteobacteria bacterium]
MTFIITLVSLVIERFFDWSHIRQWRWFMRYQAWLGMRFSAWSSYLILGFSVLPLVFIVAAINFFLTGVLFGVFKLLFGILVVMYCMGPNNFWAQIYVCVTEMHKEDPRAAMEKIQEVFGVSLPTDAQAFHHAFTNAMFIEGNRRVFAVLFWFILLGPAGSVLYRLVDLCKAKGIAVTQAAEKADRLLDWLPVRAYTFFFALAGHFTQVIRHWRMGFFAAPVANDALITQSGVAALDVLEAERIPEDGTAEQETLSLLDRVFVIGLVVLAIVVLV